MARGLAVVMGIVFHPCVKMVSADHHVITATGLGIRRRKDYRGDQHQGCRRSVTHRMPHKSRDHEGSELKQELPDAGKQRKTEWNWQHN
jgi:hypothetical protein